MCASRSSGARRPVISSSAARASCRSASTNSSGSDRRRPSTAARARIERLVRALDQRDVTHVGDRRTIAQRLDVERRARSRAASSSRPAPVVADTRDGTSGATRPRAQVGLVRDDQASAFAVARAVSTSSCIERLRSVDDDEDQVGDVAAPAARARRLRLRSTSSVVAQAGGVDQRDAQAVEVDDLRHQIARRARHVGDDRPRAPTSALNRLDLPTFGSPTIATCSPSRTAGRAARRRAARRSARSAASSARASAPGSTK